MRSKIFYINPEQIFIICSRIIFLLFLVFFPLILDIETVKAASTIPVNPANSLSGVDKCDWAGKLPCMEGQSFPTDGPLPDLQTLPPFDLRLITSNANGTRVLRFSNSVANTGGGAVELRGDLDPKDNSIVVTQHILGGDEVIEKHSVGEFIYQPDHGHYHWKGFSLYEIWSVRPGGILYEVVASSDKVGFCLMDSSMVDMTWLQANTSRAVDTSQRAGYGECTWKRQGISVGWVDTYRSNIPGQAINVSDLPNGVYALRSTVNPDGIIHEMDQSNNSAVVFFTLKDNELAVHGDQFSKVTMLKWENWFKEKTQPPTYPLEN